MYRHNQTLMLNTESLATFYGSLQELSVLEAILLYFLGYVIASIIKNLFGSEISTNFNLNKKVASGLIVAYLVVSPLNLNIQEQFQVAPNDAFSSAIMSSFPIALLLLVIFYILTRRKTMKIYFYFYAAVICLMRLHFKVSSARKCYSQINFKQPSAFGNRTDFSLEHYLNHLVFHLPNYFISIILIISATSVGTIAIIFISGLAMILIFSGLHAEFVSEETNNWNTSHYSFGYNLRESIRDFSK